MADNILFFGDNLDILKHYVKDESVDLIYLDPPFNSNRDYNAFISEKNGRVAEAQMQAFRDTWYWDSETVLAYQAVVEAGGKVADTLRAFKLLLDGSGTLAYLTMMAPRLIELRRVLKRTGSIYLHCDPTASHYLKLLMDAVFGKEDFRNEIVWKRTPFSGSSKARAQQLPRSHDVILFYTKGSKWTWNRPVQPYSENYRARFKWDDGDGRGPYRKTLLKTYSQETFDRLKAENRLIPPQKAGAKWSYKQYLSESSGETQVDDTWMDINALNPVAKERLGYPTQKPEALLERIIHASSNEGDVILDPFCGCGTATVVAHRLNRKWLGIDISSYATNVIKKRLLDTFGEAVTKQYQVIGEPATLADAENLERTNPYQFQYWSVGALGGHPTEKKSGDRGIDGRLYFHDEAVGGKTKEIVFSVKGGKTGPNDVRELRGVVERDEAQIAVFIMMREPSREMRIEAATAGFYESAWGKHPRLQIISTEDILAGKQIDYPRTRGVNVTFKQAPKADDDPKPTNLSLPLDDEEDDEEQ